MTNFGKNFNDCDISEMPKTRKSYTSEKKLEIVEYAESHGNRTTAREYQTDEKNVRNWRQQKTVLQSMKPSKRCRRFRKEFWPELESDLKDWVL